MAAVPPDYRHRAKIARAGTALEAAGARCKWYELHAADTAIVPEIAAKARVYAAEQALPAAAQPDDLGFVILHKCGEHFHFLLLQLWRGANEIWEAVYYLDEGMDGFAPFAPANPGPPAVLRPTFCVWEMGIVAFEAREWSAFLTASRDDAAVDAYLSSRFDGEV